MCACQCLEGAEGTHALTGVGDAGGGSETFIASGRCIFVTC